MSFEQQNDSFMDVYEALDTFARQHDSRSSGREIGNFRDRSLVSDLSFPIDHPEIVEQSLSNLSGRLLEAEVDEPEFFALLCHGEAAGIQGIANVVRHHGYERKNRAALQALARFGEHGAGFILRTMEHMKRTLTPAEILAQS